MKKGSVMFKVQIRKLTYFSGKPDDHEVVQFANNKCTLVTKKSP